MTRHKVTIPLLLALTAAVSLGCTDSTESTPDANTGSGPSVSPSEAESAPPTLTAPKLQPPSQQNKYTEDSGRPEVVFDPCTWISDEALVEAGFDPATRKRGSDIVAEQTFLTCDADGHLRTLQVDSGNVSWEEDLQKNGARSEPLNINGREALQVPDPDPEIDRMCSIHVRTKAGFAIFSSVRTTEGHRAGLGLCDGVPEIATALEPEIGEDN